MIQMAYAGNSATDISVSYINIYGTYYSLPSIILYRPLIGITSQQTGKSLYCIPFLATYSKNSRYVKIAFFDVGIDSPALGFIIIGNTDYPLGLYDVNIYYNTSDSNLDPTGLTLLWSGLMNYYPEDNDHANVKYIDYTDNDSDTNSVYITAE